jgi:hypothetical protein
MLILIDNRAPYPVKDKLKELGEVVGFSTNGLVYESISGHPDVFITKFADFIVTSPNLPDEYKALLKKHHIKSIEGIKPVGNKYPETAHYNAVITDRVFIHNLNFSEEKLIQAAEEKTKIHVSQGYTRCNLLALNDDKMITSDRGIYSTLKMSGIGVLFVHPGEILLPGFKNGFIGGTCGIFGNTVYFMGKLSHIADAKKLEHYIGNAGFEITELYDGPLYDGGGIFFLE